MLSKINGLWNCYIYVISTCERCRNWARCLAPLVCLRNDRARVRGWSSDRQAWESCESSQQSRWRYVHSRWKNTWQQPFKKQRKYTLQINLRCRWHNFEAKCVRMTWPTIRFELRLVVDLHRMCCGRWCLRRPQGSLLRPWQKKSPEVGQDRCPETWLDAWRLPLQHCCCVGGSRDTQSSCSCGCTKIQSRIKRSEAF